MMKVKSMRSSAGYTLIEWMVSIVIGLFLTAGIGGYLVASLETNEGTYHVGEMQERARIALQLISDDLTAVGFWGDFTGNALVDGDDLTVNATVADDCGVDLDSGDLIGTFPDSNGYFFPLWAGTVSSGAIDIGFDCVDGTARTLVDGTDVLSIKTVVGNPVDIADVSDDRIYFVSNTESALIISEDDGDPGLDNQQVWEYQHYIYFVDTDASGMPSLRRYYLVDSSGAGDGQLFGSTGADAESELVQGIEYMRVIFGVDTDEDGVIDAMMTADEDSNSNGTSDLTEFGYWSNEQVVGAKIYLLVRSLTTDGNYTNTNSYTLGDVTIAAANDSYRRMVVENMVSFRNVLINIKNI